MPLPKPNTAWPPVEWAGAFDRYAFDEAIWLNDTEGLAGVLRGGVPGGEDGRRQAAVKKRKGLIVSLMRRWGWARIPATGEKRTDLPVPIGATIAELSAAQLMSEAPMLRLFKQEDGKAVRVKSDTQSRLDLIANSDDAHTSMIEGATIAAAIGGAVLKAQWDLTDPDRESVWFDAVGADCAIPEFNQQGRLMAVTMWEEFTGSGNKIFRHFERHAVGVIEHALYQGTEHGVGKIVPLDAIAGTTELLSVVTSTDPTRTASSPYMDGLVLTIPTGLNRPTAQFWRNRPTRVWRKSGLLANLGRSDFELIEPLLDEYSTTWGSMARDVRLGAARLLVPVGMLERAGTRVGSGAIFDTEREIYSEVGGLNPEAGTDSIKDFQAAIRYQEHMGVLAGLKLEILDATGWSVASYGNPVGMDGGGGAVTATEVVDRTTKSERTRDAKALYFKQSANPFFRMLMELDGLMYQGKGGGPITDELSIDFPDVSQVDPEKQARTFLDLSTAHGISIEQTVRERRPNWDEDEVRGEVERIIADMERMLGEGTDPTTLGREVIEVDENQPPLPVEPEPVEA